MTNLDACEEGLRVGPHRFQSSKRKRKGKQTAPRVTIAQAKKAVRDAEVVEWGKVKRVDSEEGDTIYASALHTLLHDSREASFVWVGLY